MLLEVNPSALEDAMHKASKTAADIASDTGLSLGTVSRLSRGAIASTHPSTLKKISDALGVNPRTLGADYVAPTREDLLSRIERLQTELRKATLELDTFSDPGDERIYRIREERIRLGITAEELGLRIGRSEKVIRRWECKEGSIPAVDLFRMADVFGCTVDHLLGY